MEEIKDEQMKRALTFDAYGRHALIRDIINTNRKEGEIYKILDVGGRGNFMQMFLPDDRVYYLDPHVDTKEENYIEGDGSDMPLEDNSFDYAVSVDVFEHVEPADRTAFLKENLRVAKQAVILAAPFHTKEIEMAEFHANENYKIIAHGEDHVWLKEHLENGLPDMREVEEYLEKEDLAFQKIPNNNLKLWESLILSTFIDYGDADGKLKDFNLFYNEKLFPHDHGNNSYRKIYFIKKARGLKDLELKAGEIDEDLYLEAIRNNMSLYCHIYKQHRDMIAQLEQTNHKKQVELELRTRDLDHANEELANIRASNSWKITRPLRRARRLLSSHTKSVENS